MTAALLALALAQASPAPRFSAEAVERVVRSHVDDVQSCYERSMAEKHQTRKTAHGGRVVVAFTIDTTGHVQRERIASSTLKDAQVTDCILAAARSWEFPPPEQAQPVEFPFDLEPVSGPKGKSPAEKAK
jgi:TonB family protein